MAEEKKQDHVKHETNVKSEKHEPSVKSEHHVKHEAHVKKQEKKTCDHGWLIATKVVTLVLLVILVFQVGSINSKLDGLAGLEVEEKDEDQPTQPKADDKPAVELDMEELIDDDTVKGDADAPVTIVEWSDFECPFCARFYRDTMGQIQEEYIDTGKVKMVFRDFPLSFHQQAQKAGEAAECAGEQDKFWEMHDILFEEGVKGGVDSFKQFAADLGVDTAEFDECLDSDAMAEEVKKDMADGVKAGITGTPGFIINGQKISGAQPFANFKAVIDAELAE